MTRSTDHTPRPEISVAIPTYNEEDNVVQITEAVLAVLAPVTDSVEIVLIDNGSTDKTRTLIRELCARHSNVRGIFNARNFGQMRSPTHAIYACRGRAVIGMCADFQDPPALLPQFIERWRAGVPIVLAVRASEPTGALLSAIRGLSYRAVGQLGEVQPIPGATGFGLYDRKVLDIVRQWNDPEPFFRAMLVETGYPIETISYARPPRERGVSKNNWRALTGFALSALPLVSRRMFRLAFTTSLGAVLVGAGLGALALPAALLWSSWPWMLATGIALLALGCVTGLIGMLGLQVMTVSDRLRNVPMVIELERLNFPTE
jgi:glycosyltransferase involved in cell wall biosynthesis